MILDRHDHWIAGATAAPSAGAYLPTLDPISAQPWAEIARGDAADVDRAVTAAHEAFRTWRRTPPRRRAEILWRLGDLIAEHADELAGLESRDAGKVIREVRGQQAALRNWYPYYATLAHHGEGRQIPHDSETITALTVREPYGVIGVIPAFNSPMMLGAMGIAPALAAGNTVVVKPPEVNALLLLGRLAAQAGMPDGCFNVVHGYGDEAGDALVGHPLVRKVFFTGGPESARAVTARAAAGLKPAVLELGGKSANIFFDVDVEHVTNGVIAGIFAAVGQTCVAGSRLLAHPRIADQLVKAIGQRAQWIRLGNPTADSTEMGPMSQEKILAGVTSRVEQAVADGAEVVSGVARLMRSCLSVAGPLTGRTPRRRPAATATPSLSRSRRPAPSRSVPRLRPHSKPRRDPGHRPPRAAVRPGRVPHTTSTGSWPPPACPTLGHDVERT